MRRYVQQRFKSQPSTRKGFTLIEVLLVLALVGLILMGLLSGINFSLARQRYNDSVQDYAEFLRRVYSEVTNVQNPLANITVDVNYCSAPMLPEGGSATFEAQENTGGRSNCAFYGKLISFGEDDESTIYVYDVIGEVYSHTSISADTYNTSDGANDPLIKKLADQDSDILALDFTGGSCRIKPFSTMYSYQPQNLAKIETEETEEDNLFTGLVLIARSPYNNSVHTRYLTISGFNAHDTDNPCSSGGITESNSLYENLGAEWKTEDINFCVASDDIFASGNKRRNVRIAKDGGNSSAVQLINTDVNNDDMNGNGVGPDGKDDVCE